jgi:hypothetical protein
VTAYPASTSAGTAWPPIAPVPPATNTFMEERRLSDAAAVGLA